METTLSIWDKTSNLTNQLGENITPEEAQRRYGIAAKAAKTVIEVNGSGLLIAIDDLEILRSIYKIDEDVTDEETLAEIVRIRALPPAPIEDETLTPDEVIGILSGEVE